MDQLVACRLFLQRSGNDTCAITGTRYYSSDLPQGRLEVPCPLYTVATFMVMQKLERSYKLSTCKSTLILMGFNLMQASLAVDSSNLTLYQIFLLYGTCYLKPSNVSGALNLVFLCSHRFSVLYSRKILRIYGWQCLCQIKYRHMNCSSGDNQSSNYNPSILVICILKVNHQI